MAEETRGAPGSAARPPLPALGPSWAGWARSVPLFPQNGAPAEHPAPPAASERPAGFGAFWKIN